MLDSLRRFFGFGKATPDKRETLNWFSPKTVSGVFITPDEALKNPVVWACVTYLTDAIGPLPWRVHRERSDGGNDMQNLHHVDYLLHRQPNPEMGAMTWRQLMIGRLVLYGNAYSEIQRNTRGQAIALWPLHPERVDPRRDENGALFYRVWNDDRTHVDIAPAEMFHIRQFGDGVRGLGTIQLAAQTIGWAQATELFGAAFFGNGMNAAHLIEGGPETPEGRARLDKELQDRFGGSKKAHKVIFGGRDIKVHKMSTDPNDGQFIETMQHQVETICRWFRVPPHKVQHLLRATFTNIEHQSIEVVLDSLVPRMKLLEQEADMKLLNGNYGGLYTKINERALMRGDMQSQAQYFRELRNMGLMSADEARSLLDMNPIPGGAGQAYMMQSQYTTLDRIVSGENEQAADVAPKIDPLTGEVKANNAAIH